MASQVRSILLIVLLVGAGAVIFALTLGQNKPQSEGVVLQEIFNQKPTSAQAQVAAPIAVQEHNLKMAQDAAIQEAKMVDPVPAMAIVTSPEDGQETGFAIQVYSFQDKKRAEAALEVLKNSGYQAFMIMSDLGEKGTWYRVRVGGIPNEAEAQKLLAEIRTSYNSGFIVKPKN